jgi:O-antigen/teichoic acid export membrane protein
MDLVGRMTRGAFYQTASTVCRGLFAFLLTPFIIQALGTRRYGLWILLLAFLGSYELFDLGISGAVSRYVSRSLGTEDETEMNRFVTTSGAIFVLVGAVVALITAAVAAVIPLFLKDPAEAALIRAAVLVLGFGMAAYFPLKIFHGALVANLRYDLLSKVSLARIILSSALTYGMLSAGYGLLTLALIAVAFRLAEGIAIVVLAYRVLPRLAIRPGLVTMSAARQLLGYGLKYFAAGIGDLLRFRIDAVVIAAVLNLNLVAVYDIGQKLSNIGKELVGSALNVMIPVFSRYEGQNNFESIRDKFVLFTRFGTMLAVFTGGSLVIYGRDLIRRWVGSGFADSYIILVILCVPMIIELTQSSSVQLLYGISKHHYYALVNISEAVVNLLLSLILAKLYGIYGVALGTAIGMAIFRSLILPRIVCREIGLPLRDYYLRVLIAPALKIAAPLVAFNYLARSFITPDYPRIVLIGALQVAVFVPIVYLLVLGREERAFVQRALRCGR